MANLDEQLQAAIIAEEQRKAEEARKAAEEAAKQQQAQGAAEPAAKYAVRRK